MQAWVFSSSGVCGAGCAGEIGRRSDGNKAGIAAEFHRDHIERHRLAKPYAGIETVGNDIDEPIVGDEIERHVGIACEKGRDGGIEQHPRGDLAGIDPQRAAGMAAEFVDLLERQIEIPEQWRQTGDEALAGFRRRDAAGRPVEKPNAHIGFERTHHMAERRRRQTQFIGGLAEAAMGDDGRQGSQIGKGRPVIHG